MPKPPFEPPPRRKFRLIGGGKPRDRDIDLAAEDAAALEERIVGLVNDANESSWYHEEGNDADVATAALCRLRRAAAGAARGAEGGDEAVRRALEAADPAAVVWVASRAISYMDEQGFPDFVPR